MDEINLVGILGAGTMAKGIANLLAQRDIKTIIWSRGDPGRVLGHLSDIIDVKIRSGNMGLADKDNILGNITVTSDINDLSQLEFIIESISEDFEAKSEVLKTISTFENVKVIATNTSSLSITELAKNLITPSKLIGLHFFNPPDRLQFVEIIYAGSPGNPAVELCQDFCDQLDLMYITIPDETGSVVNRILCAMLNEAAKIYSQYAGHISHNDIDIAMIEGASFPIGPFALSDLIGIDVFLAMAKQFERRFPEMNLNPATIWQQMIEKNKLGVKNKAGFYNYA